jgi:hypothetical protein
MSNCRKDYGQKLKLQYGISLQKAVVSPATPLRYARPPSMPEQDSDRKELMWMDENYQEHFVKNL